MPAKEARTLCFVDDDPAELARFRKAFEPDFRVVATTTYSEAVQELKAAGRRSPHLWVLDLYFPADGRVTTAEEIHEMSVRFESFDRARLEFVTYLASIGQGREGGLKLLSRVKESHATPVVMFTRKGTIDDAIACLSAGAAEVLKKPMPQNLPKDKDARAAALDKALVDAKTQLADRFEALIAKNTHWARYRSRYFALTTFILGILIERTLGWIGI